MTSVSWKTSTRCPTGEGGNLYLVNGNMIPITMTAAGTGKEGADAQAIDAGKPV